MLNMIFLITLLTLSLSAGMEGYKILVLFPHPSYSHQRPIMALTERLIQDGHELFVISPNAVRELSDHDNYTFVDMSFAYESISDQKKNGTIQLQQQMSKWSFGKLFPLLANIATMQYSSAPFLQFKQRVVSETINFDVAIVETFYNPFACAVARFLAGSAPIISVSTGTVDPITEDELGSITHSSFLPSLFCPYTDRMNLWQKLDNWFSNIYLVSSMKNEMRKSAIKYFSDIYGPQTETFVENCRPGLSLVTSHPVYFYPRLLGPNVIEVGPLHLKPPEKLSKRLQDWLDGAEKTVIYFSLGSNMKSKSMSETAIANFLKFFGNLPPGYRVLWKYELDEKIPGQPDNVMIQKWMPQHSVLAHPKVQLFITQGGVQSFQEAVHYSVPTVGVPWYSDQGSTVAKMVDAKVGVQLLPDELESYEKIKTAIETVLHNNSYLRNMQKLSAISQDFTSQAMDKAVFWVEHVARHGDPSYLKPSTADASLFEFFCLDIISVVLIVNIFISFAIYSIIKFCKEQQQKFNIKIKKS